jgi:hypothetical protein
MQFFETYYYANVIHNVLSEPFAYLRHLNDWHENIQEELFTAPFSKWSVLHSLWCSPRKRSHGIGWES